MISNLKIIPDINKSPILNRRHTALIKVRDLCKTYRSGDTVNRVLKGIDLTVYCREFLSIMVIAYLINCFKFQQL